MPSKRTRKIIFRSAIGIFLVSILVLPFVFQKKVDEKLTDIPQSQPVPMTQAQTTPAQEPTTTAPAGPQTTATGSFRSLNRQQGSGDVTLIKQGTKNYIRLESNFQVSPGPDLFVSLGSNESSAKIIAPLKGNSGGQNYELPADVNPDQYSQVFIHCRAFAYSFSVADLKR